MANIHFKTALDSIKRSPFQAIAAVFVLSLTFFIGTVLAVLVYASNNLINYFESRPQVIAFLKDEATSEQVSALQNKLTNDSRVKEVHYVSKEEALSIYKKATSDNPLLSELVSPSIFPASLEFSMTNLSFAQNVIDEVKTEAIVSQVGFTASLGGESALQDVVGKLKTLTYYLRWGGGVFVGLLVAASLVILLVIVGMRITSKRSEIEILDLIGATPEFIRSPILLEALLYSVSGVFVGWLISLILWLYASPSIVSYFGEISVIPKDNLGFFTLFGIILGIELVVGVVLAVSGSLLAIARARKSR